MSLVIKCSSSLHHTKFWGGYYAHTLTCSNSCGTEFGYEGIASISAMMPKQPQENVRAAPLEEQLGTLAGQAAAV